MIDKILAKEIKLMLSKDILTKQISDDNMKIDITLDRFQRAVMKDKDGNLI
jgi:hypothetical protein